MNPSLSALLGTILFTGLEDDDTPLDENYDTCDFDEESKATLSRRFAVFVNKAEDKIREVRGDNWCSIEEFYVGSGQSPYQLEHDFVMTCQGHGCGYWETGDWEVEIGKILTNLAKEHGDFEAEVGDDEVIRLNFHNKEWGRNGG